MKVPAARRLGSRSVAKIHERGFSCGLTPLGLLRLLRTALLLLLLRTGRLLLRMTLLLLLLPRGRWLMNSPGLRASRGRSGSATQRSFPTVFLREVIVNFDEVKEFERQDGN